MVAARTRRRTAAPQCPLQGAAGVVLSACPLFGFPLEVAVRHALTAALALALSSTLLPACQREQAAPEIPLAATDGEHPAVADATPPPAEAPAQDELAMRVISQSAAVKEGEVVLIMGRQHDAGLMEDLAVAARKTGAFPMIVYESDRLSRRMFFDVPARYDSQADALGLKLAETADVLIDIGNDTTENLFEGADPARMAARGKADGAVLEAFTRNNVRTVELGNNLYPAPWRAERYGMSTEALADLFWKGIDVDYTQLQARGEEVKAAIAAGRKLHVTHPNGTDLSFDVQGRRVLASDGLLSEEDLKQGGAATAIYLPAGDVYTTPVPGTGEGKLVHTRTHFRGKQIDDLTLTFAGGKVTGISGSGPGYADFKAAHDAVDDARKDELGYIDFGINPNIELPASASIGSWVPAGSVTVGTGANVWAGGDNMAPFGITVHLTGSTVTLDDKPVVDKGVLRL